MKKYWVQDRQALDNRLEYYCNDLSSFLSRMMFTAENQISFLSSTVTDLRSLESLWKELKLLNQLSFKFFVIFICAFRLSFDESQFSSFISPGSFDFVFNLSVISS